MKHSFFESLTGHITFLKYLSYLNYQPYCYTVLSFDTGKIKQYKNH